MIKVDKVRGMDIIIVTTAQRRTRKQRSLLKAIGVPFRGEKAGRAAAVRLDEGVKIPR